MLPTNPFINPCDPKQTVVKTFNINLLCCQPTLATLFSLCGGVRKYHSQLLLLLWVSFPIECCYFFLLDFYFSGEAIMFAKAECRKLPLPSKLSRSLSLPPTRTALVCEREGDSAFSTKKRKLFCALSNAFMIAADLFLASSMTSSRHTAFSPPHSYSHSHSLIL